MTPRSVGGERRRAHGLCEPAELYIGTGGLLG